MTRAVDLYGTQAKVAVETKELEGKTIENDAEFAAGMKTCV